MYFKDLWLCTNSLYFLVQILSYESSQVMFGCQMPAKCILFVLGSCPDSEVEAWHDELFNPTNLHQYEMNGAGSSVLPQQKTCGVDEKRGVQTRLEATRQPDDFCFSSNYTSSCRCLLLLGCWAAVLSWCDSSAALYSNCCQTKRQ